jgi:excisionase family DNA binding protein
MKLLNTAEAAKLLGVSARRVRALIDAGKLTAHQLGREYAIEESALETVRTYGKAGRPPKVKASGLDGKVNVKQSKRDSKK